MKIKSDFSPLGSSNQIDLEKKNCEYFETSIGNTEEKLRSIMRFLSRQELAKILSLTELFQKTTNINGSIAECGAYWGQSLMLWAKLSATLEPYNYQCKAIGFDTFKGNTKSSKKDKGGKLNLSKYSFEAKTYDDLKKSIEIFDSDRPLNHIEKVELVKGDLIRTSKSYLIKNPQTIFRIISLSVNLYNPTLEVLKNFYPKLSPGGIVMINGLNITTGATNALYDYFKTSKNEIPKIYAIPYYPNVSYFIK
jgi:hypothetical protein